MDSQTNLEKKEFWCKKATVYFVYSLSLAPKNDFGGFVLDPTSLKDLITSKPRILIGDPDCRKGIMPHLEFESCCAYVDYSPVKARMGKDIEVEVGKLIRLFCTAGTCTIRVTMKSPRGRDLKTEDILHALGLVGRLKQNGDPSQQHMLKMKNGPPKRIYDIFFDTVKDLCARSNKNLRWLEKSSLDFIDIEKDKEVQSPFVVTVAEVEKEVAETFCEVEEIGEKDPARLKMLRIRQYEHYLAPILFRSLGKAEDRNNWLRLEPSYVDPPTPGGIPGLFNQNIDSRLYCRFSRRSILCICRDRFEQPASFLLPDILNVCELVRSRWHMLIMMNRELDNTLQQMREMLREGRRLNQEDQVLQLIKLRYWLSTSYEDPGLYMIAGDAMSKLYDYMKEAFRLEELRENLQGKMNLVDRLSQDIEEFDWLLSSPVRPSRTRKKKS